MGSWPDETGTQGSRPGVNSVDESPVDPANDASGSEEPPSAPIRRIEVVAGVIRDVRGRVLLTRRTEGRDLAGMWEFPGGKREPGESAESALIRELHEELGIEAEVGADVIRVPQRYPDKRLCLDVREIRSWRGSARGKEGQALVWVPPEKLPSYIMPPADRPVVAALLHPASYLVTPEPLDTDDVWLKGLQRSLESGVRRVQLRAPAAEPARWRRLARKAVDLCRKNRADVLLNGDAELAVALGVGLHLRASQLATTASRPIPANRLLAASCHDADELRAAQAIGCDFAVVGAIKATASHPGVAGIGWERFAVMRESVSLPIYAIGGLTQDDHLPARQHGAQGVAAIRGLWGG